MFELPWRLTVAAKVDVCSHMIILQRITAVFNEIEARVLEILLDETQSRDDSMNRSPQISLAQEKDPAMDHGVFEFKNGDLLH